MIKINTDAAPAAIGPYSQAILLGDMIFTSGQLPIEWPDCKVRLQPELRLY